MSFTPVPKVPVFRSEVLRDLAADVPHCMRCFAGNDKNIVGAHLNALWAGKGMGIKAHDLVAYLCPECHLEMDGVIQRGLTAEECEHQLLRAVFLSTVWSLQTGHLQIKKKP